jgi:predicted GNAT family acetyltransferase
MEHQVEHIEHEHRFVIRELGHEAVLEYYELPDGTLDLARTYTPHEIRGRGIATALIKHALEHARERGLKVVPGCPFVQTYVDRHSQYADLLADGWQHRQQQHG